MVYGASLVGRWARRMDLEGVCTSVDKEIGVRVVRNFVPSPPQGRRVAMLNGLGHHVPVMQLYARGRECASARSERPQSE